MRIVNHLARERRAEFRDAERAARRAELLGRQAERHGRIENRHRRLVIERNRLRIAMREVFEHFDDGRIIMAEDVELDDTAADGMIVEMRRNRAAVHVVRRMLERREEMHVHVARHDHDAGRMLARRRFDAHAAMREAVDVRAVLSHAFFLKELLDIAERRLVGDGLNRARTIDIVLAEEDFRVLVCRRLIRTREIQVDVRHFVAIETEENGERDVVAVLDERRAADRADLVRQVVAAAIGTVRDELAVLAVRAAPMRRQRIDLRDARHRRDERRADGTTRTDEIAVVIRLLDKALGNQVQHGEAMPNDGLELLFQAVFDDFRQVLAIHILRAAVGHRADFFIRERNLRRIQDFLARERHEALDAVRDFARVRHDGLIGEFRPEIVELREHLLRRAQIERRLELSIIKALALHEDSAIDAVLGIEEMDVAGRDKRFSELLCELGDLEINGAQVVVRLDVREIVAAFQEVIVVNRLDFEIVIERRNLFELLVRLMLLDGADELACLAGRTNQQALAELLDDFARQARLTVEETQM